MIKVLILICAMDLARIDCQPWSARLSLEHRGERNAVGCMFNGQAILAASGIEVRKDEYVKVQCRRSGDPMRTG